MKSPRACMLLALLVFGSLAAHAQSSFFRPLASFRVIRTAHFDIIFPGESEMSARMLASYADGIYEKMAAILGIDVSFRIPVVLNPHTDVFNGFYSFFPTPHIMLFDAPMDIEWTAFDDSLKGLFIHELAHALSMNARGPAGRFLHRVFGSAAIPSVLFNSPLFMLEGIAVSFESLSGFGRANDPLIRQRLRQAVHEGEFLTPIQAAGVYDLPLQGAFFHEYGGLFSAWLLQTRGAEMYLELWREMGRISGPSVFVYRSGFFRAFRSVYGVDFLDAWADFRASFALDGLEENPSEVLPRRRRFFSERNDFIDGLAAGGGSVFALDGRESMVRVYDAATGATRSFRVGVLGAYDIDASADGRTVLVSGYRAVGDRLEAVVTEHWADTGRRTGRAVRGMHRARYFRDGVIGIRSEGHSPLIVFEDFGGNSEVLFRGSPGLLFSGPQVLDSDRIALVAARGGARELWLYDFSAGELFRVETSCGGGEYWRHMRGLGASGGRLFFSHNADDRMFRLAAVDLDSMRAVFSGRDFSGGVFSPVYANGAVYYRGAFFSRDRLLRFPEAADSLSGSRSDLALVRLDRASFEPLGETRGGDARGDEMRGAAPAGSALIEPPVFETSRYFAIRHMNPFGAWLPLPLIRLSGSGISMDGGGLVSFMADPTQRNFAHVMAFADMRYRMARISSLSWQNTALGFPLTLDFSDAVAHSGGLPYRGTRAGLSGAFLFSAGRWAARLSLGGSYVRIADYDGAASAYSWGETESFFVVSTGIGFSTLRRRPHEIFGTGASVNIAAASAAAAFEPRVAGMFRASSEGHVPASIALFGAYDRSGMDLRGASRRHGSPMFSQFVPSEYAHPPGLELGWLVGAEAAVGLFSAEIQNNLSHAYFNRIFGALALRSVFYDGQGHPDAPGAAIGDMRVAQSLALRLGMVMTFHQVQQFARAFLEPNVWAAWKFSNAIAGRGDQWRWGLGVNLRM